MATFSHVIMCLHLLTKNINLLKIKYPWLFITSRHICVPIYYKCNLWHNLNNMSLNRILSDNLGYNHIIPTFNRFLLNYEIKNLSHYTYTYT